jgi:response regulator RpfG family c-di-GMP phosphodiesterase
MTEARNELNVLLIEGRPCRLNLIRKTLDDECTRVRLHTVRAGRDLARVFRQDVPYEDTPEPDLVMFDFSQPEQCYLKLIEQLKSTEEFAKMPLVLLTRPESEELLAHKYDAVEDCVMFSPIALADFLKTMNSHCIDRFMNAVTLISNLGFVRVRAPAEFAERGFSAGSA